MLHLNFRGFIPAAHHHDLDFRGWLMGLTLLQSSLYSELKILIHRFTAILNKKRQQGLNKVATYVQIG